MAALKRLGAQSSVRLKFPLTPPAVIKGAAGGGGATRLSRIAFPKFLTTIFATFPKFQRERGCVQVCPADPVVQI